MKNTVHAPGACGAASRLFFAQQIILKWRTDSGQAHERILFPRFLLTEMYMRR